MELEPIYIFSKTRKIVFTKKELSELLQKAYNQGFYVGSCQLEAPTKTPIGFSDDK